MAVIENVLNTQSKSQYVEDDDGETYLFLHEQNINLHSTISNKVEQLVQMKWFLELRLTSFEFGQSHMETIFSQRVTRQPTSEARNGVLLFPLFSANEFNWAVKDRYEINIFASHEACAIIQ